MMTRFTLAVLSLKGVRTQSTKTSDRSRLTDGPHVLRLV
jgi:hypothetical protein